jgi:zinc/manganese transport system permease protein
VIADIFSYPFMVNAFWAGTIVSAVAGLIGWFMVLRKQSFAGHALAVVGFPGAAGATLLGISVAWGYFGFCLAAALVIALLPRVSGETRAEESAVTGTVQAFALACGFLFVSLYRGYLSGLNALLFGSFLGITRADVWMLAIAGVVTLSVLAAIGRPLLFASVDREVAAAAGVPVRALSVAFLLLLGAAVAGAVQITGTLLVFALLVAPAATAQVITVRPGVGLLLSPLIALAITWGSLLLAFYWPYPIGFFVTSLAFGAYVAARAAVALRDRRASDGGSRSRAAAVADAGLGAAHDAGTHAGHAHDASARVPA